MTADHCQHNECHAKPMRWSRITLCTQMTTLFVIQEGHMARQDRGLPAHCHSNTNSLLLSSKSTTMT